MDYLILKDLVRRNWKNVALIILGILLYSQCGKSKELLLSSELSKAKAKDFLQQSRLASKNLQGMNAKYKSKIDSIVKIENKYKNQLAQNSKTVKAKLSDLRHYSTTDKTNYFKERYSDSVNVIQVENGTILKDSINRLVITDLVIGDGARAESKILRKLIITKDEKFVVCDNTVDSLKIGIKTMSENYEKANSEKDNIISQSEKTLKREKRKKNVWKGIAALIATGAGYLLFVK